MARKKKPEEHENHERWLVSYADFITLLFAFFVVMYALSSINEGKYRVLSDSLIAAFKNAPKSIKPIQIGEPIKAPPKIMSQSQIEMEARQAQQGETTDEGQEGASGKAGGTPREVDNMKKVASRIERTLGGMIEQELISVTKTGKGLEVEVNSNVLFESGSALLQINAIPVLVDIAAIVKTVPNAIRIEGYTDNVPIETPVYPSNWELSAARAASVVHLFADEGVDPFRMAAVGYGQYRPIAMNDTAAGRKRNRRIVILLLSEAAEKLYEKDKAIEFKAETTRRRDVDLDAPVPLVEMPVMTPTTSVPEDMPKDLDLRARGQSANSQERNRLRSVTDKLDEVSPPPLPALPEGAQP